MKTESKEIKIEIKTVKLGRSSFVYLWMWGEETVQKESKDVCYQTLESLAEVHEWMKTESKEIGAVVCMNV